MQVVLLTKWVPICRPEYGDIQNIQTAHDGKQNASYYFSADSSVTIPLPVDSLIFPKITVGGWIKLSSSNNMSLTER